MKKNFTVNISGILFNIDEDAYERLQEYINRLNAHFSNSQEGSEIISDIESRIAEMMQAKLSETKSLITIKDIDEIISKMGEPSDFEEELGEENEDKEEYKTKREPKSAKRFYRNPDDAMLGGISSGLGLYFNVDPILFRLAFVFLTIFGGSGLIIYLVLWIVIPEAKTTAQKLEMKGEPVNIENIEKKIKEEFENLNDKFHDLKDKHFKKKDGLGKTLNDIVNVFAQIILAILKFVGFAFAIAFGIASVVLLIMLFIGIFPGSIVFNNIDGFGINYVSDLLNFVFSSDSEVKYVVISLGLLVVVPLISIIYNGARYIFGVKKHTPNLGYIFNILWIIGLVMFVVSAFKVADEFSDDNTSEVEISANHINGDTLFVKLNQFNYTDLDRNKSELFLKIDDEGFIKNNKIYLLSDINVSESDNDDFKIVIEKYSKGKTIRMADLKINNIDFDYSLEDSLFVFSPFYSIHKDDKWRNQEVEIYIYKPKGKHIEFISEETNKDIERKTIRHYKWEFK